MNNLKTYFSSPEKRRSNGLSQTSASVVPEESNCSRVEPAPEEEGAQENGADNEKNESSSPLYIIKTPRPDSKLILQNMEEVLNSVKKKHRQKHRRKKEQKKMALLEAEAVAVAMKAMEGNQDEASKTSARKSSKKPLREKTEQVVNGGSLTKPKQKQSMTKKSPLKAVATNSTILKHFPLTPKKDEEEAGGNEKAAGTKESPKKNTKTNAFEIMMNARNKSIGSNTPGKESPLDAEATSASPATVKRKIFLQEWAEKKGGAKRKLEEESRAAYIEKQLENRAKRLKKMLVNGNSQNSEETEKPKENSKKTLKSSANRETAEKPQRTQRRPRARRLTSTDSVELVDCTEQDPDTAEFLAKLSSPTKKRDSLLGYFPKKESPKDENAKNSQTTATSIIVNNVNDTIETPKRSRRSKAKRVIEENLSPTTELAAKIDTESRPRRSCAGKTRYDHDTQESPTKLIKTSKNTESGKTLKSQPKPVTPAETEEIIIDLDDSTSNTTPHQTPKKLAPLFVRSMPKPSPDPDSLKARKAFLMSGVPEKMRLEKAKQKQYEQNREEALMLFPKVSHVMQWTDQEIKFIAETVKLKFRIKPDGIDNKPYSPVSNTRRSKGAKTRAIGSITACTPKDFRTIGRNLNKTFFLPNNEPLLPILENKRAIIKLWKTEFARFPTYKCYNQMREKYRYFSAIDSAQDTEQVTESFVVTRRTRRSLEAQKKFDPDAEEEKPPPSAPNGELLFTEKYKPMLFEQVLVNLTPITQLREFLSSWSAGTSARNSQGMDDSFDIANDSNSSQLAACNTVVLLGPGSSGKTNAVFALANEMNFNVLEINAGMKRTGKKLLQELQEATQSHQIRKDSNIQGKAQKNLLKMSLNGLKSKTKSSSQTIDVDGNSSSTELGSSSRKCLILIEDADIVFDQMDAGFTDAIYSLAASSKRPVIIVASNPNCQHLQRLINQNTIHFSSPNVLNISKFLAVLSLIENCPVNMDDLISLYLYNRRDLRRTLMELQFFIQSGGDGKRKTDVAVQKKEKKESTSTDSPFYASPSKRRFSEEPTASLVTENEDASSKEVESAKPETKDKVYMHRSLFEFYTVGQNEKTRIPFPVDFQLLRINLNDVFQASPKLQTLPDATANVSNGKHGSAPKRKSRSPKKAWLNSATAAAHQMTPLDSLCDFYENASVAALLGACDGVSGEDRGTALFADRLVPHLAENIAHVLVERAIDVNLESAPCPYNLFDTPKERHCLLDHLGTIVVRTQRTRSLDFEPSLRQICRSEKLRSSLERRSSRFYHYLRNSSANLCSFSTEHFDNACSVFVDEDSQACETLAANTAAPT